MAPCIGVDGFRRVRLTDTDFLGRFPMPEESPVQDNLPTFNVIEAHMKADVATHSSQARRERYGFVFGMFAAVIWGGYLAVTRQGIAVGLTAADSPSCAMQSPA